MASLYKTAAAICLAGLCWLKSEAMAETNYKFTAEEVTEEAYVAVNLVRNGKLQVQIKEVAKDAVLETALKGKIATEGKASENTCASLIKSDLKTMFHHTFDYAPTLDYRQLLQDALDEGMKVFKAKKSASSGNVWQEIWATDEGASLAYLLASNSTTIACAVGKCTQVDTDLDSGGGGGRMSAHLREGRSQAEDGTEKAVLFCELKPPAEANQAPFSEEYFDGLLARTALLKDMTEDDLKAPSNGAIAPAAIPGVFIAGFVAMLTAVFA